MRGRSSFLLGTRDLSVGLRKQAEGGRNADWKPVISWRREGRRPIRGGQNGDRHHMPSVADRTIAQRFAGQFFVEIAVVGFVLRRAGPAKGKTTPSNWRHRASLAWR